MTNLTETTFIYWSELHYYLGWYQLAMLSGLFGAAIGFAIIKGRGMFVFLFVLCLPLFGFAELWPEPDIYELQEYWDYIGEDNKLFVHTGQPGSSVPASKEYVAEDGTILKAKEYMGLIGWQVLYHGSAAGDHGMFWDGVDATDRYDMPAPCAPNDHEAGWRIKRGGVWEHFCCEFSIYEEGSVGTNQYPWTTNDVASVVSNLNSVSEALYVETVYGNFRNAQLLDKIVNSLGGYDGNNNQAQLDLIIGLLSDASGGINATMAQVGDQVDEMSDNIEQQLISSNMEAGAAAAAAAVARSIIIENLELLISETEIQTTAINQSLTHLSDINLIVDNIENIVDEFHSENVTKLNDMNTQLMQCNTTLSAISADDDRRDDLLQQILEALNSSSGGGGYSGPEGGTEEDWEELIALMNSLNNNVQSVKSGVDDIVQNIEEINLTTEAQLELMDSGSMIVNDLIVQERIDVIKNVMNNAVRAGGELAVIDSSAVGELQSILDELDLDDNEINFKVADENVYNATDQSRNILLDVWDNSANALRTTSELIEESETPDIETMGSSIESDYESSEEALDEDYNTAETGYNDMSGSADSGLSAIDDIASDSWLNNLFQLNVPDLGRNPNWNISFPLGYSLGENGTIRGGTIIWDYLHFNWEDVEVEIDIIRYIEIAFLTIGAMWLSIKIVRKGIS